MDRPPYHPLHYTPVNDGAKWNSIFSARVRYLATLAQRANVESTWPVRHGGFLLSKNRLLTGMSKAHPQPDANQLAILEEVVGYLNYSSGASDTKFLRNLNALFRSIENRLPEDDSAIDVLCAWLDDQMVRLSSSSSVFGDVDQARAVILLLREHLLPAYRTFHRDLLWHQSDRELCRPLFVGRAFEAILAQGGPWHETERIVAGALDALNDYLGYRPVAVLESERQMEPYRHERLRPVPLYIHDVGVAPGMYEELIERALAILKDTDAEILQQAWFDPQLVEELRSIRALMTSIILPASGPIITSANGICIASTIAVTIGGSCCSRSRSMHCFRALTRLRIATGDGRLRVHKLCADLLTRHLCPLRGPETRQNRPALARRADV